MRRAKIVATLGPATSTYDDIMSVLEAGANILRMNLSHGTRDVHEEIYGNVRRAAADADKPIGVLVDLQGPKIRLEKFSAGPHELSPGDTFTITIRDVEGTKDLVGTTYKGLPGDVRAGDTLLIDDGKVRLEAVSTSAEDVVTRVVVGGPVSNNKGINLPGVAVSAPALSEKDEDDLRWGLGLGCDYVALSFVRSAPDVDRVREIMREEGRSCPIIAKIEKPEAVEALEEIVDAFDGIMVARGDLGVELPPETVPIVQKRAIEFARKMAKPVIVATQMLESMIESATPTRAEVNDVANAVGPLAAIVQASQSGMVESTAAIPLWVMIIGALGISFGLFLFGPKLIHMVGNQITKLNPMRAYCVALSAAITVIVASWLGLPVSSTHIAVGGVFGVGFFREWDADRRRQRLQIGLSKSDLPGREEKKRRKLVRRSHFMTIIAAWVITVPSAALISAAIYSVFSNL